MTLARIFLDIVHVHGQLTSLFYMVLINEAGDSTSKTQPTSCGITVLVTMPGCSFGYFAILRGAKLFQTLKPI
jgi:hypothetical protein